MRQLLSDVAHNPVNTMYEGLGTIVLYHRIIQPNEHVEWLSPYSGLIVSTQEFEKQIAYFSQNFECVTLDEFLDRLGNQSRGNKRLLAVTFDDGFKDNLEFGLPCLEKYDVPATVYIATGLVDQTMELWWEEIQFLLNRLTSIDIYWGPKAGRFPLTTVKEKENVCTCLSNIAKDLPPTALKVLFESLRKQSHESFSYSSTALSWDQVRELDRHPLITIGAHTIGHHSLRRISEAALAYEITESKRLIEEQLGHEIFHFSFPYGSQDHVTKREVEAVRSAGFRSAVTTLFGHIFREHEQNFHALPRIGIDYTDTLPYLRWKLTGSAASFRNRGQKVITIK
jgi:peptidoglycan/xylan/chitin deacetylase (PgdA/CDA1 family)